MKRKLHILLTVCLWGVLAGCSKDPQPKPVTGGGTSLFTISMEVPGTAQVKSKALTEADERQVETIDLLLFKADASDGDAEKFDRRIKIDQIANDDAVNILRTFSVALPLDADNDYRIVLLANLRDEVDALDPDTDLAEGALKQNILDLIKFDIRTVGTGTPPKFLPMYGETEVLTPILSTTSFPTVQLLRSVARFDIVQGADLYATGDVELTGIVIYNYHEEGYAAPGPNMYSPVYRTVSGPTPAGNADASLPLEIVFSDPEKSEREIYLAEQASLPKMIVGAKYQGGAERWYNVSLSGSNSDFDQLLRNHRYTVTIHDISGDGYPSPEEAGEGSDVIPGDVVPWDEAYNDNDVVEGTYWLEIDKRYFKFNADGRNGYRLNIYKDHKINIETNLPQGWHISKITDEHGTELTGGQIWVGLEKGYRVQANPYEDWGYSDTDWEQWVVTAKPNVGTSRRIANMHIKAGRWEYIIRVEQDYLRDTECGRDADRKLMNIGGKEYKTQLIVDEYATNTARCWMAQNIAIIPRNGHRYKTRYDDTKQDGERGFYYEGLAEVVENVCPEGWRLPYQHEFYALGQAIMGSEQNIIRAAAWDSRPEYYQDWCTPAVGNESYAGYLQEEISTGIIVPWFWDQAIYWMMNKKNSTIDASSTCYYYQFIINQDYTEISSNALSLGNNFERNFYFPARCIKIPEWEQN